MRRLENKAVGSATVTRNPWMSMTTLLQGVPLHSLKIKHERYSAAEHSGKQSSLHRASEIVNKSGFEHGLWTYQHQKSGQEQLSSNSFETEQGYRMIVDFNS